MLRKFLSGNPSVLDEPIADILSKMNETEKDSEEYKNLLFNLSSLMEMKSNERPNRVTADTLVMAGANLLGVLIITSYDRVGNASQKALNWVARPKGPTIS